MIDRHGITTPEYFLEFQKVYDKVPVVHLVHIDIELSFLSHKYKQE